MVSNHGLAHSLHSRNTSMGCSFALRLMHHSQRGHDARKIGQNPRPLVYLYESLAIVTYVFPKLRTSKQWIYHLSDSSSNCHLYCFHMNYRFALIGFESRLLTHLGCLVVGLSKTAKTSLMCCVQGISFTVKITLQCCRSYWRIHREIGRDLRCF